MSATCRHCGTSEANHQPGGSARTHQWAPRVDARPLLLDLYCCQGGASRGYELAGFDVVGVDLFAEHTRPRYPYPAHQGDAIAALDHLLGGNGLIVEKDGHRQIVWLRDVAAIAASPPCQHASAGTRAMRTNGDSRHPALIEPTRERLTATGLPYVIENVKGAALRDPVLLCWSMFDQPLVGNEDGVLLRMERHRLFESNLPLHAPGLCRHDRNVQVAGAYGAAQRTIEGAKRRRGGYVPSKPVQERLMGIDWMTERALHQAIPPAYTRHIGAQLMAHLRQQVAA